MKDQPLTGDYKAIRHMLDHLAQAFDEYVNEHHPVDYMTGMMAVLNLAKRVAIETDKQSTVPDGWWRRLFVINFLRMMSNRTYDTQDPLIGELVGLPTDEFWSVISDLVEDSNES